MLKKVFFFLFITCFLVFGSFAVENDYFEIKRQRMVEEQIKQRGITNENLLSAMLRVKRHLFVPQQLQSSAYQDNPLPIGEDQTISQPYIVALMTELLSLDGGERVLEIGTGSGYQAAILAELAQEVYTIEILPVLAERSKRVLNDLGYENIFVKKGDGFLGWPEHAPFDAIIVTCAPEEIPEPLIKQLAEGGRMVIPVGKQWRWQELKLVEKENGELIITNIAPVRFVPMLRE